MPDRNQQLRVENLSVSIGGTAIVSDVSLEIRYNETFGIIGESGSGKSTLALALMGMAGNGRDAKISGEVFLAERRISGLSSKQLREVRGKEIAVILQDPMSSLNPVFTVGNQLAETLTCHRRRFDNAQQLNSAMIEALQSVHIPAPEQRLANYPHQMSGGMRQRIVGALAMAAQPQLLIADEPTTSLDATLQVQFLQLLKELQRQSAATDRPMSVLLITHDFGAVAKNCDRVGVMYAGRLVETGDVNSIFQRPAHPYTAALMASRPQLNQLQERLAAIPGAPPRAGEQFSGCPFAPRCEKAQPQCHEQAPVMATINSQRQVACWFPNAEGELHG